MANLRFELEYDWEPFILEGRHLTFKQHQTARLYKSKCSHWGAAIYKWEGILTEGPMAGNTGILIGETDDLRQRIKQYVGGTQKSGNVYWRDNFLTKGDIRLNIFRLKTTYFWIDGSAKLDLDLQDLSSGNRRVFYEQLLIMHEVIEDRPNTWIVNRKL